MHLYEGYQLAMCVSKGRRAVNGHRSVRLLAERPVSQIYQPRNIAQVMAVGFTLSSKGGTA